MRSPRLSYAGASADEQSAEATVCIVDIAAEPAIPNRMWWRSLLLVTKERRALAALIQDWWEGSRRLLSGEVTKSQVRLSTIYSLPLAVS